MNSPHHALNYLLVRHTEIVNDAQLHNRYATEIICAECRCRMAIPYKDGDEIEQGIAHEDNQALQLLADCYEAIHHTSRCNTFKAYQVLKQYMEKH